MIYLASLNENLDDKLNGYYLIKTKNELNKIDTDTSVSNKVIIRSDFAREYFTLSGLAAYIQNAKKFNQNLVITIEDIELSDVNGFISKLSKADDIDELITLAVRYPNEFADSVKYLIDKYKERSDEVLSSANMVSRLQSVIEIQNKTIAELKDSVVLEQENKLAAENKLDILVKRINNQYNKGIDKSKIFTIEGNRFDKVLYFKEITRIQYFDSFIYYLKEILKILYGMPTRAIVIEGYYGTSVVRQYEGYVPHNQLTVQDVLYGDVLMLGMQPKVMQSILKNAGGTSILIILDRGKYRVPHVKGTNVEYFYTVSDLKDKPASIPDSRTFSYSENTLFIPYIQDFDQLDSSMKLSKYSSLDAMKRIIRYTEGR